VHCGRNYSTSNTFFSFEMVVFTHGCVGGRLINSSSVGVPFCSCKSCCNLSRVGFLDGFVYKLAKFQTYTSISQFCLCKHVLLTWTHLCEKLQKLGLGCFNSSITLVQIVNTFWFLNYVYA
jgi:hypothetical protein